jgi:ribosome biogenesis GTPase / thiamine phosphate phosphatase
MAMQGEAMRLEDLGFNDKLERYCQEIDLTGLEIGRVIAEHKERYIVKTITGEFEAEILGNMRFTAKSREDFPAVGDWVALAIYDRDFAIIHIILPRSSIIKRAAVGQPGGIQIIAANIDYALLLQAADRDFNLNRLERYLTICYSAKVSPLIVISKTDLIDDQQVSEILESIKARIQNIPVIALSNETQDGYDHLKRTIEKGKSYCMLGSSGVGKSTLLNNLSGEAIMRTDKISQSTNKGRHITSHRELTILETGGILIDNPGMREVGITDASSGIETTFHMITRLSHNCKYKDCTHMHESGCAVLEAVDKGDIDPASFENYRKMEREKAHFESSVVERREKEKEFGKSLKNYKKDMKKGKF